MVLDSLNFVYRFKKIRIKYKMILKLNSKKIILQNNIGEDYVKMKKGMIILIIFAIAGVIAISGCTSESGTITTDILDTQNCSLNASNFADAKNTVDAYTNEFDVQHTPSNTDITFEKEHDADLPSGIPTKYEAAANAVNTGSVTGKKTTIANITGYISEDQVNTETVQSSWLTFIFIKDGVTYTISGSTPNYDDEILELNNPRGLSVQGAFSDILEQWNK